MAISIKLRVVRLVKALGKVSALAFLAFATLWMNPSAPGTADARGAQGIVHLGDAPPYVVKFEKGDGRLIVVPPFARGNVVQFMFEAYGLEDREYEITLERADRAGGATFGQEDLHVIYGTKKTDTIVVPSGGVILTWSIAPMRMVSGGSARVVLHRRDRWEEIAAQSTIFIGPAPRSIDDR